jgi:hypothetical protein
MQLLLAHSRSINLILDYQHSIFLELFDNKLALAPIDSIPLHNVLDLATGELLIDNRLSFINVNCI